MSAETDQLPSLDQSAFPPVPTHRNLYIQLGSKLGRYEQECFLGAVALIASLSQKWRPVSITECRWILQQHGLNPPSTGEILKEANDLAVKQYGEIIRIGETDYFVPNPAFVRHFTHPHHAA